MTDPGHPETCNVCHYWQVFAPEEAPHVWQECRTSKRGCTQNKEELAQLLVRVTEPFRAIRRQVQMTGAAAGATGDPDEILARGAKKARQVAQETMREVRKLVGLPEEARQPA